MSTKKNPARVLNVGQNNLLHVNFTVGSRSIIYSPGVSRVSFLLALVLALMSQVTW